MCCTLEIMLIETVTVSESDPILSIEIPDNEAMDSTKLESISTQQVLYIGEIYADAASPAEFTAAMQSLSAAQKYALLTKHKVPSKNDGMFCIFCAIFYNRDTL